MKISLRKIDRRDEKKAMQFAVKGMHLDRYVKGKLAMKIYARYFWYQETERATQCIAAYAGGRFSGILLADIRGEPHLYRSFFRKIYVKTIQWILDRFFGAASGAYERANLEMYRDYRRNQDPDGELIFLAADPSHKIKGIGSRMLAELEKREAGKLVYLYTDDGCTWQFYEHRGFTLEGEKNIQMEMGEKKVPMNCMLYSKRLGCMV